MLIWAIFRWCFCARGCTEGPGTGSVGARNGEGGGQRPGDLEVPLCPRQTAQGEVGRAAGAADPRVFGHQHIFPASAGAVWGYNTIFCGSGSCCLVLSTKRDISRGRWSTGYFHLAVRSIHLVGFSRPFHSPKLFLPFLCCCRNLVGDPGAGVWQVMGNIHSSLSTSRHLTYPSPHPDCSHGLPDSTSR